MKANGIVRYSKYKILNMSSMIKHVCIVRTRQFDGIAN